MRAGQHGRRGGKAVGQHMAGGSGAAGEEAELALCFECRTSVADWQYTERLEQAAGYKAAKGLKREGSKGRQRGAEGSGGIVARADGLPHRIADGLFELKPGDSLADGLSHVVVGLKLGDAVAVAGDLREHGLDDGAEEVLEVLPAGAPAQAGRQV